MEKSKWTGREDEMKEKEVYNQIQTGIAKILLCTQARVSKAKRLTRNKVSNKCTNLTPVLVKGSKRLCEPRLRKNWKRMRLSLERCETAEANIDEPKVYCPLRASDNSATCCKQSDKECHGEESSIASAADVHSEQTGVLDCHGEEPSIACTPDVHSEQIRALGIAFDPDGHTEQTYTLKNRSHGEELSIASIPKGGEEKNAEVALATKCNGKEERVASAPSVLSVLKNSNMNKKAKGGPKDKQKKIKGKKPLPVQKNTITSCIMKNRKIDDKKECDAGL